jgi:hypothetical protein
MAKITIALFASLLLGTAFAQPAPAPGSGGIPGAPVGQVNAATNLATTRTPDQSPCAAKAIDKNGKPLAGAAKNSFMKKCAAGDAPVDNSAACEAKAIDKNGKPLAGAAKASFLKKCMAG